MEQHPLVGKTITKVQIAKDRLAIKFDIAEGEPIIALADADCCSHTWIESLDAPENLLGLVISVEDIAMGDLPPSEYVDEYDYIQYYGCKIKTSKGICVIDYRNESNGYYGGNLSWPNDKYFYGGVYGQNVSIQEWQDAQE